MFAFRTLSLALLVLMLAVGAGASSARAAAPRATPAVSSPSAPTDSLGGKVNINTATAAELAWLPGVGPSRAERIVAYRAKHNFAKVVELARVKGIGLKTVRKLSPWLTVTGPTTATGRIAMPREDS